MAQLRIPEPDLARTETDGMAKGNQPLGEYHALVDQILLGSMGLGELGVHNEGGLLVLTVPLQAGQRVEKHFGDALVRGPKHGLSLDGTARVARYWERLRPGFPLGVLGELGVEAG